MLAALLGNYILTENDLAEFYKKLNVTTNLNKVNVEHTLKTIANFVRDLPSVELDVVSQKVFGSLSDPRSSKLRQSVQYYINGTKEGFLHYKPVKPNKGKILLHFNLEVILVYFYDLKSNSKFVFFFFSTQIGLETKCASAVKFI